MADPTQCEFERERAQLIQAIDSFVTPAQLVAPNTTSFLGPLKPQQWAILSTTRRPSPATFGV